MGRGNVYQIYHRICPVTTAMARLNLVRRLWGNDGWDQYDTTILLRYCYAHLC